MKAIDLFCGCGGMSTGLKRAGFHILCGVEILDAARQTYTHNHKSTITYSDIREVNLQLLKKQCNLTRGELDLLAACPPCQGFSSIRTRNKEVSRDPRNELIFQVTRFAEELMPKAILIENVPRLLTDYRLKEFTKQLKKLGYYVECGVLDAQDFRTPQRRKRMILIACRLGRIPLPTPNDRKLTVRDAIGHLPPADSAHNIPLHNMRQKLSSLVQDRVNHIKHNRSELPENLVLECHKKYRNGFRDVYGRMSWNEVSPTITRSSHNPSKGRFIHPKENRGLTLYEAMLLQGFPKDYKFRIELGLGKISSMIGEAVPPPMAAAQGLHIKRMLAILEKQTG